ncbi:class I SAM-dependent methyltransferase [Ruegeria profundi]|uniref:Methyltransferase domain-containing protein n=1 Tax=Ruegeria profundi TaxID=1685378 RepID=A0A0X3TPW2_9RHOB|nr:class I SAM-dependent methyltransferase [Ruegeria profundi]KUJ77777.1 hypothetical protein AVO44_15735 [Ruegeria profundi]
MSLKTAIVRQFGKPTSLVGKLAGHIMARRSSNRLRNQRTVELMNLQPDSRVLEIGCGPGLALALCAETVSEGRIIGLDHSPVMIEQARKRLEASGSESSVDLVFGGVDRLKEWPGAFDRVYSLNLIQFIADKTDFFQRVFATLDQGGICLTTYQPRLDNEDPNGASAMADKVTRIMKEAGFKQVVRIGIVAGPSPALCVIGQKEVRR